MKDTVIIVGAGATRADSGSRSPKYRPPLDRGFFAGVRSARLRPQDLDTVQTYLQHHYRITLFDGDEDSFERVLSVIYSDIFGGPDRRGAERAFRAMLRLLHHRIVGTTNSLSPRKKARLYRIVVKLLRSGLEPNDITIITFNYDNPGGKSSIGDRGHSGLGAPQTNLVLP